MNKKYHKPFINIYRILLNKNIQAGSLGDGADTGGDYSKSLHGINWDQFDDEEDK